MPSQFSRGHDGPFWDMFGRDFFAFRVTVPSHVFEKARFSGEARKFQRTRIQSPDFGDLTRGSEN